MFNRGLMVGMVGLLCAVAWGQGGGFGGGAGLQRGGGVGGGSLGSIGLDKGGIHEEDGMYVFRGGGILTAAEDAPYPVILKAGGTLIVSVTSNEFDAAVRVTDEKGVKLVENDDSGPGTQNAQLVFRAEKDGNYKVMVESFKSKAGGNFEIELKYFMSTPVTVGDSCVLGAAPNTTFVELALKKGQVAYLANDSHLFSPTQVVFPNGDVLPSGDALKKAGSNDRLFQAASDGNYFFQYDRITKNPDTLKTRLMKPVTLESGGSAPAADGQLADWIFVKGKKGETVMVQVPEGSETRYWNDGFLDIANSTAENGLDFENNGKMDKVPPAIMWEIPRKQLNVQPLVFTRDGEMPVLVLRKDGKGATSVRPLATPYQIGNKVTAQLPINGDLYYQINGKKGEWFDLMVDSVAFDPEVTLFNSDGLRTVDMDDLGASLNPKVSVLLDESGPYWVRVRSSGGGGAFTISSSMVPVPTFPASGTVEADIDSFRSYAWSSNLKAGDTFMIRMEGTVASLEIKPEVEDAVATSLVNLNGMKVLMVRVLKDSPARYWVHGSGHIKLTKQAF